MAPKGHKKWGGRQRGSKNKKTLEQEQLREMLNERVAEKWLDLLEIELREAKKDIKARHYIIDQVIGRAVERKKLEIPVELEIDF